MPASSMLIRVLVMWSVPVLIYLVLFFPELKQAFGNGSPSISRRHVGTQNASDGSSFEYLLPMAPGATMALIFGLLIGASWPVCLMLMAAGSALLGGIAYTLVQMHDAGIPPEARN
jgi:hypothetical protein